MGARIAFSVFGAVLLWLVGRLIFIPIAEGVTVHLLGYPLTTIVSVLIAVALAIITIAVFIDVHRLSGGLAGITAYHFGKATGELRAEEVCNYRTALDGFLYVMIVSLTYLLLFDYLGYIHPAIPAVLLVLIVVWAIYALWQSTRAIANIVDRYALKTADRLDEKAVKTEKKDAAELKQSLKNFANTTHLVLFVFLVWLFANLVFIPIASSVNWQTRLVVTLIMFGTFTALILRMFPNVKRLLDAFSVVPARKFFVKRGLDYSESLNVSRQLLYVVSLIVLYLLYLPFLVNFHAAFGGIVLILVLVLCFFCVLRIARVTSKSVIDWLLS